MTRQKIVAGNWKMNKTFEQAEELLYAIAEGLDETDTDRVTVVVCPPSLYIEMAGDLAEESGFFVGAQNIYDQDSGAFTGEISAPMLASMGADFVILGHSERRNYFGETDDFINRKVKAALKHNLIPILCCGENLGERSQGIQQEIVRSQLLKCLEGVSHEEMMKIVVAYEPVWAIGTGVNATPAQAQEMHAFIRQLIAGIYDDSTAEQITILYGGSCNSGNAGELFSQPDVDGGLIGGASLKVDEFLKIVRSIP